MRFVTPKNEAQQPLSVLHRLRESLIRDRTKTINQLHGFLLEFGISLPVGKSVIRRLPSVLSEHELPVRLYALLQRLYKLATVNSGIAIKKLMTELICRPQCMLFLAG